MGSLIIIILCILLWGGATFLNRIAVDNMSPFLMQMVVGFSYILYIPVALKMAGANTKWTGGSVVLTVLATICSIAANVLLYTTLKGSNHTGQTTMLISLYPVVTLILSVIFLHEILTPWKIVGIFAMIVGAVILTFL